MSRCGGAPGAGGLLSSPPTPGSTSFPPHSQSLLSSAEGHGPSQNTASVSLSGTPRSRSAREREREDKRSVHIKKPLNAFMLYMKEMRPKIVAECTLKESAAINQILGRRVRLDKIFTVKKNEILGKLPLFVSNSSGTVSAGRNRQSITSRPAKNVNCICKCILDGPPGTITLKVKRKNGRGSRKQQVF